MLEVIDSNGRKVMPDRSFGFRDMASLAIIGDYAVIGTFRMIDLDGIIADSAGNGMRYFFNGRGAKATGALELADDLHEAGCLTTRRHGQLSELIRRNKARKDGPTSNGGMKYAIRIASKNGFYVSGVDGAGDRLRFVPSRRLDPDAFDLGMRHGLIWMKPEDFGQAFGSDSAAADRECALTIDAINRFRRGMQVVNVLHVIPVTRISQGTYACGSEGWRRITGDIWTDQLEKLLEKLCASDISHALRNGVVIR